jgi:predicted negative regulator of RcsB-dependent stress response
MADYRTEEEQIELLRKWWNENGKAIVGGVVVALAVFFGAQQWKGHQQAKREAAADLFQQMVLMSESSADAAKAAGLAEQLRQDYANTVYGAFATLHLAKDAVTANDLPRAASLLDAASQQGHEASLQPVIYLRLAQVQYAQGELDKALSSLAAITDAAAWQAAVSELRGDILLAQGKADDARGAYQAALAALDTNGNQDQRVTLEVKLSGLVKPASNTEAAGEKS